MHGTDKMSITTFSAFMLDGDTHDIRIIQDADQVLYCATDVGAVLGMSKIRNSLNALPAEYRVKRLCSTRGGTQTLTFLTIHGMKWMTSKSRSPHANVLAKQLLNMEVLDVRVPSHEDGTLAIIMKAFAGEAMETQYSVDGYRIDLYMPDYKIAIECDEPQHAWQREADAVRQSAIEKKLGCTFIRYEPLSPGFDIVTVINQVFRCIRASSVFRA